VDTELLDTRTMIINIVDNAHVIPYIVMNMPTQLVLLFKDWMHDDQVFEKLLTFVHVPVIHVTRLMEHILSQQHSSTKPIVVLGDSGLQLPAQQRKLLAQIKTIELNHETERDEVIHTVHGNGRSTRHLLQNEPTKIDLSIFRLSDESIQRVMDNAQDNVGRFEKKQRDYNGMFESATGFSCVIDYGVVFNSIIQRFANFLQKEGWKTKRSCSQTEIMQFSSQSIICPILQEPFARILNNTNILIKYYQYMALSTCLKNMSVSCLPPAMFQASGILEAIPAVTKPPNNSSASLITLSEGDLFSNSLIRIFTVSSSIIGFDYDNTISTLLAFSSIGALTNDTLYVEMTEKNQISLGRLLRDLLVCNLEDTIYCEKKNLKLFDSFVAMFMILAIVSYTLPIPSVPYYLMWVFGLSYGVLYLSYNFSALCFPRIPTCLGNGIFELTQTIFPPEIQIPRALYNWQVCDSQLNIKPEYLSVVPLPTCGKSCLSAPFGTGPILSIVAAIEITLRKQSPTYSIAIIEYMRVIIPGATIDSYLDTIVVILENYSKNIDNYQGALFICILLNSYKLISLIIFIFMFLPFIAKIFFMSFNIALLLFLKTIFIEQVEEKDDENEDLE
jgi:hypothetical protein